jgi:predicted nucleic acid-binding protein
LTLYLDTSVLVTALTRERDSDRIQHWLNDQSDELAISAWVVTEFSSALSLKLRSGQLDAAIRAEALAMFARWAGEVFTLLPIVSPNFHTAARFADQHALGLRAGDALHLAISEAAGATLCTRDRRLSEGGLALGLRTTLL